MTEQQEPGVAQADIAEGDIEIESIERIETEHHGCEFRFPLTGNECTGDAVARVSFGEKGEILVCPDHGGGEVMADGS